MRDRKHAYASLKPVVSIDDAVVRGRRVEHAYTVEIRDAARRLPLLDVEMPFAQRAVAACSESVDQFLVDVRLLKEHEDEVVSLGIGRVQVCEIRLCAR